MTPMCKYSFSGGDSETDCDFNPPSKTKKKIGHDDNEKVKEVSSPVKEKEVAASEKHKSRTSVEKKIDKTVSPSKNNICKDKIDEAAASSAKSYVEKSDAEKDVVRSPSPNQTVVNNKEKHLKIKQIFERRSSSSGKSDKSDKSSRSDKPESRKSEEKSSEKTKLDSKSKGDHRHSSSKKSRSDSRKLPSECFAEAREKAIRKSLSNCSSSVDSSPRPNFETPARERTAIIASIPLKSL